MTISRLALGIRVEREDIANSFVEVFGLVKQGLAVEGGNVFVEIDCKEVEAPNSGVQCRIVVLKIVMEEVCCLGCNRTDLLIAPCVARNKENGDSTKL